MLPAPVRRRWALLRRRLDELERLTSEQSTRIRHLEIALQTLIANPVYSPDPTVGFNGQIARKRLLEEILRAVEVAALVETGTWTGNTAGYLAATGLPVRTVEKNPLYHALARRRLAHLRNVHLANLDSRMFLRGLAEDPACHGARLFFYLDAHWEHDLPLAEEVEAIASGWKEFVIMIDDFEVPDDPGYKYDDYGPDRALTMSYLAPLLQRYDLVPFAPRVASAEETGQRRGCVVLTCRGHLADRLEQLRGLRRLSEG